MEEEEEEDDEDDAADAAAAAAAARVDAREAGVSTQMQLGEVGELGVSSSTHSILHDDSRAFAAAAAAEIGTRGRVGGLYSTMD